MGGNALKNTFTERKTTEEFNKIAEKIIPIFEKGLGLEIHIVESYSSKETHGDMDILVKITEEFHNKKIDLNQFVDDTFKPNERYTNGSVISFDYDQFQIDLIPIKESNWEVSKTFFSFDPSGNLMGKVAHKFGIKYGFNGLNYPFRNFNGRLSTDIVISKDDRKIFEFLGYDYDRYLKGFDTVLEIFNFVIDSKYFNTEVFQMANLSSIDRKRNKKRPTYQAFLKHLDENNINQVFDFLPREDYLAIIDVHFPESRLLEKITELHRKDEQNKEMHSKFNGKLVMAKLPDLRGSDLGYAMGNFQKSFEDYSEYILSNSTEQIMEDFINTLK